MSNPFEYQLTPEDLQAFFQEKKAYNGCPCCNDKSWTMLQAPPAIAWHLPSHFTQPIFGENPKLDVVFLLCNNCGFLRTHAAFVIQVFTAEKKKKAGQDE